MDRHSYVYLPCLREKMKQANCSIKGLADATGISTYPVKRALAGQRIWLKNGLWIYEALNTRKFTRTTHGSKL